MTTPRPEVIDRTGCSYKMLQCLPLSGSSPRPLPARPAGEGVRQARSGGTAHFPDPCRLARQVKQFGGYGPRLAPGTPSPAGQAGRGRREEAPREGEMQRRTRIVATLGPATDRPGVLEQILDLGL